MRLALLIMTLFFTPTIVRAAPVDGGYAGLGAGLTVQNSDVTPSANAPTPLQQTLRHDKTSSFVGSVGQGFGNGFRVEMEGNYAHSAH